MPLSIGRRLREETVFVRVLKLPRPRIFLDTEL
jgi:hypothetical protein